ncbi:MAG: ATP-binding protein, partial [Paludibacter sp.]|nr:ATP-binding protein [Paludibacter sp.]
MDELNGMQQVDYSDSNIITLEGLEHVRRRPGMYIGKLGDGSHADDGIYVLLKEVLDNCVDEFRMGAGKQINVTVHDRYVEVRDFGRGIPLGKMIDAVSIMNTGGKYDSKAFKKSVGLNGVGTKAVNALSDKFIVQSFREGQTRRAEFEKGKITTETGITEDTTSERGTYVYFEPDNTMFEKYKYNEEFIETMLRNYAYLNTGLTIRFNDKKISSKNGLLDLLNENITADMLYPIIHLKGEDIEIAFTHTDQYGEEYYSFVNGQHTTHGGTHQSAFREAVGRTIKEFYNKNMELTDVRNGIVAAVAISVEEPVFESQTKTKLGSRDMAKDGVSINKYISDFLKKELDNYLHRNTETSNILLQKIQDSEKERKAIAGVTKLARERAKKVNLHNKKLRDCRLHYNDIKGNVDDSCIFI